MCRNCVSESWRARAGLEVHTYAYVRLGRRAAKRSPNAHHDDGGSSVMIQQATASTSIIMRRVVPLCTPTVDRQTQSSLLSQPRLILVQSPKAQARPSEGRARQPQEPLREAGAAAMIRGKEVCIYVMHDWTDRCTRSDGLAKS